MSPFGKSPGQYLPDGSEDYREIAIMQLQAKMEEIRQALVANNLKMLTRRAGEVSSEVRTVK